MDPHGQTRACTDGNTPVPQQRVNGDMFRAPSVARSVFLGSPSASSASGKAERQECRAGARRSQGARKTHRRWEFSRQTTRGFRSAEGAAQYQPRLRAWVYAPPCIPRSERPAHCMTCRSYGPSARFLVVSPFSWAFSPGCSVLAPLALQTGAQPQPPERYRLYRHRLCRGFLTLSGWGHLNTFHEPRILDASGASILQGDRGLSGQGSMRKGIQPCTGKCRGAVLCKRLQGLGQR